MKRPLMIALFGLLIIITLGAVSWEGFTQVFGQAESGSMGSVQVDRVRMRQDGSVDLMLTGRNFARETRIVSSLDAGNRRALVTQLPLWGRSLDMELDGDYLYIANHGSGLQIVSLSDPQHPRVLRTQTTSAPVTAVDREGERLYLTLPQKGVQLVTLASQGEPAAHMTLPLQGKTLACAVKDGILFVAADRHGVQIYDASDDDVLANLERIEFLAEIDIATRVRDVAVTDDHVLYVATDSAGLQLYDVKNPASPQLFAVVMPGEKVRSFRVKDGLLCLAVDSGTLQFYDLGDPFNPRHLGVMPTPYRIHRMEISGDRLYLVDNAYGLHIYDIGQPEGPRSLGYYDTGNQAFAMAFKDGYAYVLVNKGLQVVDLQSIDQPHYLSSIDFSSVVKGMLAADDRIYQVAGHTIQVLQRAADGRLRPSARLNNKQTAFNLLKHQDYLYVTQGRNGLGVIDVSDPDHPVKLQGLALPGRQLGLEKVGDRLYLAGGQAGFHVVDIAHPAQPRLLETISLQGVVRSIATDGRYLYLATSFNGLQIYQLDSSPSPVWVGQLVMPWPMSQFEHVLDVVVREDKLFLAVGENGVRIVDIGNPREPDIVASIHLPGFCTGVHLDDNNLYSLNSGSGMHLIDISDVTSPRNLGEVVNTARVWAMLALSDSLVLSSGRAGLLEVPKPRELSDFEIVDSDRIVLNVPEPVSPGHYSLHISNTHEQLTLPGVVGF